MTFFGTTKQAALDDVSTACCLRNDTQFVKVSGDSNAWKQTD